MGQIDSRRLKHRIVKATPWMGLIGVLFFSLRMMSWSYERLIEAQLRLPHAPTGWVQAVGFIFRSVGDQVQRLQALDLENEKLRLELELMRTQFQKYQFEVEKESAQRKTKQIENRLSQETGAQVGRTLSAISYRPPRHLPPAQLLTLALAHLQGFEDEKAAVILTHLTSLEQTDFYRTPEILLLTGMVWYRLDHLVMAEAYFDEVLKQKSEASALPYFAQARLWKAVLAQRSHKKSQAQYWLSQLVENHPHSMEAQWVNQRGEDDEQKIHE